MRDNDGFPFIAQAGMPTGPIRSIRIPQFFKFLLDIQAFWYSGVSAIYQNISCIKSGVFKRDLDMGKSSRAAEKQRQPRRVCRHVSVLPSTPCTSQYTP